MAIILELKLCLSNFCRGVEKQKGYLGINIEVSRVQLIYFNPIRTWGCFPPGSKFFANNCGSDKGTQSKLSDFS